VNGSDAFNTGHGCYPNREMIGVMGPFADLTESDRHEISQNPDCVAGTSHVVTVIAAGLATDSGHGNWHTGCVGP